MKISIVTQSYYPRPGGVTEHVHHTASELRRRGHDVTIVTTHFRKSDASEPGIIRIGRNALFPINGAWVNVTTGVRIYRQLRDVLHRLDADVIHTHCPLAPTLPVMALKVAPKSSRVIGTFHAAADRMAAYYFFKPIIDRLITRIDTRVAVSEAALALARGYFPGRYEIIPNGVDCDRFGPQHEPIDTLCDDAFNILFVGRMDKRKGLKFLFRAVAALSHRTSRRLRLIVVGDDGFRRALLPRLPKTVDVVFTGVVDKSLLPRYFATGDVLCSPAIERESFGIVLLEAMASGIPLIGTAIPGYLSILRDGSNALVVPPRDANALSAALEQLMVDETLRWKIRANGLSFAKHFEWSRIVDQLESVYRGDRPLTSHEATSSVPWPVDNILDAQKA